MILVESLVIYFSDGRFFFIIISILPHLSPRRNIKKHGTGSFSPASCSFSYRNMILIGLADVLLSHRLRKLAVIQLVVEAVLLEQLLVGALLDNFARLYNQN